MPPGSTPQPDPSPPFIFLSYASPDRPRIAGWTDFLRRQSIPLWWDQDIPAGDTWRSRIAAQLGSAHGVVTFWTQASVNSKAVIEEAAQAQALGKLIPVRLDDAPLPYGFAETQYLDLRDWDGTATHPQMRKLLQALSDKLNPPDPAAISARISAASPVAMLPVNGKLVPFDTPPHAPPEKLNDPDCEDRIEGLRQTLSAIRPMAADRDKYQCPADLGEALKIVDTFLNAPKPSWHGFQNAQVILSECMKDHDAKSAWNGVLVSALNRLIKGMKGMRPCLQPVQVPLDLPGAKPPVTDPVVRKADIVEVATLANDLSVAMETEDAAKTLSQDAINAVLSEIDLIRTAANAPTEKRKFARLRQGVKGLAYMSGAIISGVSIGVTTNLLTAPEAAITLAQRLQPILDRLIHFFL
ncbi:MAG: toll/interleukin-1 receptor domain-containing protein [Rhodobacterales bacterium]|nr:toll/interleukin-1 receptor domain-containing protein [Rhodobacterales bacterium]